MWESADTAASTFQHPGQSAASNLSDSLSYKRSNGTIVRLPNYSPGIAFVDLDWRSGFQIRAKPLFPVIYSADPREAAFSRFLLQIRRNGAPCYMRRYVACETSLSAAADNARRWIDAERQKEQFEFLFSFPILLLLGLLLIFSWFLYPVIGWVSIIPILLSLPAACYSAPGRFRTRCSAALAGFRWDRNDFCRGWLITGDTGAGKTFAINTLLHSVFQNEPDWGGLCCDEKGILSRDAGANGQTVRTRTGSVVVADQTGPRVGRLDSSRPIQPSFRPDDTVVNLCDCHCRYRFIACWRSGG
jgi:hypothetical protein